MHCKATSCPLSLPVTASLLRWTGSSQSHQQSFAARFGAPERYIIATTEYCIYKVRLFPIEEHKHKGRKALARHRLGLLLLVQTDT